MKGSKEGLVQRVVNVFLIKREDEFLNDIEEQRRIMTSLVCRTKRVRQNVNNRNTLIITVEDNGSYHKVKQLISTPMV